MSIKIPLLRPYFDSEEMEEIKKVLDSGWVSQGPEVKKFERMTSEYLNAKNTIAVSNCTSALHLSLLALGIEKGDEVLVADFTYPATGHSVLYCQANPVFVDIKPDTYNMDPEDLNSKITDKSKTVIPVHTFGQPADMDEIMKIASENNLKVIEDAACSFGAKYKDKFSGTIGDTGCYSFHARKGLTTGEGGMIVTEDDRLAARMRKLSVFGISGTWDRESSDSFHVPEFTEVGYNYKMSDILAAVGVVQLKRQDLIIKRKRELAKHWDDLLNEMDDIQPPAISKYSIHVYQSYVPILDRGLNRNRVIQKLRKKGIQANIGTYASHVQPVYASPKNCPTSVDIFERTIALPMYYGLEEEEINEMSAFLRSTIAEVR